MEDASPETYTLIKDVVLYIVSGITALFGWFIKELRGELKEIHEKNIQQDLALQSVKDETSQASEFVKEARKELKDINKHLQSFELKLERFETLLTSRNK